MAVFSCPQLSLANWGNSHLFFLASFPSLCSNVKFQFKQRSYGGASYTPVRLPTALASCENTAAWLFLLHLERSCQYHVSLPVYASTCSLTSRNLCFTIMISWSIRILDTTTTYYWHAVHVEIFLAIQVIVSKMTSFHLYVHIAFDSSVWLVVFNLDMFSLFLSCVRVHGVGGKSRSFVPFIIAQSGVWVCQLTSSWLYSLILFCRGSRRLGLSWRGSRGGGRPSQHWIPYIRNHKAFLLLNSGSK